MIKTRKKILFVCSKNQIRSLTAEIIFRDHPLFEVRSAGTSSKAKHQISTKDLLWADKIVCMEQKHQQIIKNRFAKLDLPQSK